MEKGKCHWVLLCTLIHVVISIKNLKEPVMVFMKEPVKNWWLVKV
jgi:hypothetical protein